MNKVVAAIAVLLLAGFGSLPGAEPSDAPFLATVSGSVVKQELITPVDLRVRTSALNTKRIFQEFQVSPTDYVLVVDPTVSLVLLPKSASSGKPTIPVFKLDDLSTFMDTKIRAGRFVSGAVNSTAVDNLFEGLSGTAQGSYKFIVANGSMNVTKIIFSFVGRGSDISREGEKTLLQFKVVSGKRFIQNP